MKKLFIYFFTVIIIFPLSAKSQIDSIPKNSDGRFEYTEVVNADSVSADKLYSNAKLFVATNFRSGKSVTQLNDDAAKTVAGNGSLPMKFRGLNAGADEFVLFKFIVQCRDGRYKYIINNFELQAIPAGPVQLENEKMVKRYATKNMRDQIYEQVHERMKDLVSKLKEAMVATKDW